MCDNGCDIDARRVVVNLMDTPRRKAATVCWSTCHLKRKRVGLANFQKNCDDSVMQLRIRLCC